MTKKHGNLPITLAELGALYGTEQLMKKHVIVYSVDEEVEGDTHKFNMDVTCRVEGCGSVGCIGGTMAQVMGMGGDAGNHYVHCGVNEATEGRIGHSPILTPLFFPPRLYAFDKITIPMALQAIKNFLDSGNPKWDTVKGIKKTIIKD